MVYCFFRDVPLVEDSQILLFHTEECLSNLKNICKQAKKTHMKVYIDGDTSVMVGSRAFIYEAACCIIAAVDDIYSPSTGNAQLVSNLISNNNYHSSITRAMFVEYLDD
jgi:acetoin utilization deacetylase AcuC-like enzyme